ncbi:type I secretion system permease/ATPase [Chthonobacter rhizosphaerae]|uniref:type I secretion system permease/ATPase n=1 Tax=Chthonobacter rhizosphaerae TaxID=2735553 RepID=UPI0015EF6EC4|nr:type I secretion system permease/ATPase [Chthonobacter rhizosphaerae]
MGNDTLATINEGRRVFLRGLVWAGVVSAFINILQLAVPIYMLQTHDRVITSHSYDTLTMLTILTVGALVTYGALEYVRSSTFLVLGNRLIRQLNLPTLEAALGAAQQDGLGKATQALRDLSEVRGFITGNAVGAPMEAIWSPIFMAVLTLLHPLYGLVALISAVAVVALSLVADLLSKQVLKEANDAQLEATGRMAAALRQAEVIEAMGMLPAVGRRWEKAQRTAMGLMDVGTRRAKAVSALSRTVRYGMQVATIALGAILVIEGLVSPGAMVAASIIMGRVLQPFDNMIENWRSWRSAGSAWERIRDTLEAWRPNRETTPLPLPEGPLVVEGLVYGVPGNTVALLRGLEFRLEPGDVLGIIGPSAVGKSSLARLLVGTIKPNAGGIFLGGHNVYGWERGSFGRAVGYLPQSISLLDGTIRENIARMQDEDPALVIRAARLAGVHDMIGRLPLGYDTPVGDGRLTLSGGQKQRIALARALYGDPRLIVLDEPNANLDAEGEAALVRAIGEMSALGSIVVMIAHRPSIMQAANKLLVLEKNQRWQFGPRSSVAGAVDRDGKVQPLRPQAVPPVKEA